MRTRALLLAATVTACGGAQSEPAPAEPATEPAQPAPAAAPAEPAPADAAEPAHLPPPFTADELRTGIPVGTEMRFRIETPNDPVRIQHWHFTAADPSGTTIAARILAEDGSLIADQGEGTSSWAELESHAHFPKDRSTRSEVQVTVPAGTYDAWLYEVQPGQGGQLLKRFYFAKELAGPPVLMEVFAGDEQVMKMQLVSRTEP